MRRKILFGTKNFRNDSSKKHPCEMPMLTSVGWGMLTNLTLSNRINRLVELGTNGREGLLRST